MTTIESKLKEMEQSTVKAKAFERNRQIAVARGMRPDVPTTLKIEQAEMLIQALREAVAGLEFYATEWGSHHGYTEPTNEAIQKVLNEKRSTAIEALTSIEKILGEQK